MVRATMVFPARRGARFDWAYYSKQHGATVKQLLGASLQRAEFAKTRGAMGTIPTAFVAISLFYFENMTVLEAAMPAAANKLLEDVAKFTDIVPQIYTEEVL